MQKPLQAIIAGSHYEPDGEGDGDKLLINYYLDENPQDASRPKRLATTPGSRLVGEDGDFTGGSLRGLFQADTLFGGDLVVADGTTLRRYDPDGDSYTAMTGTVTGADPVMAAINDAEAMFNSGGKLFHTSDGSTLTEASASGGIANQLAAEGVTEIKSVDQIDFRMFFVYGNKIGYSPVGNFTGVTDNAFYAPTAAPDGLVRGFIHGGILHACGTKTMELWYQSGVGTDPLNRATRIVPRGLAGRNCIASVAGELCFIGDDLDVYVLQGTRPVSILGSEAWVTRFLEGADMSTVVCSEQEIEGHAMFIINAPIGTIAYSFKTRRWHKRITNGLAFYEYAYFAKRGNLLYGASRNAEKLAHISREYYSDDQAAPLTFGTVINRTFTAHVPMRRGIDELGTIRLEGTKGIGQPAGQGNDPMVSMEISRNGGNTYGAGRSRAVGAQGEYGTRTKWETNGSIEPEQTVLKFTIGDFVQFIPKQVLCGEEV